MDVDYFVNKVVLNGGELTEDERVVVINDILIRNKYLPLKNPFTWEYLIQFKDVDLILYLVDIHTLYAFAFFKKNSINLSNPYSYLLV